MKKPYYIASCSFGKDSIATILTALKHGEPLNEIIYIRIMYDKNNNISAEFPEHEKFIHEVAIPHFEKLGLKTTILTPTKDFLDVFYHKIGEKSKHPERIGKFHGFPLVNKCVINSKQKILTLNKYIKKLAKHSDIYEYIGLAADEPKRLARMGKNKISLLAKYNITEAEAFAICTEAKLLSPYYQHNKRNGCWFCPNQSNSQWQYLHDFVPQYWKYMEELSKTPNLIKYKIRPNATLEDIKTKIIKNKP